MDEIDVTKYFIIHKDKNDKIFAIEQINPKELFEAITKQNEQLHRYKQVVREIEEIVRNATKIHHSIATNISANAILDIINEVNNK